MSNRSITTLLLGVFVVTAIGLASCGGIESPSQPAKPIEPSPKVRAVSVTTGRVIVDTITAIASLVVDVRDSVTRAPRAGIELRFVMLDDIPGFVDAGIEVATNQFSSTAVDTTDSLGQVSVRIRLGPFVGTRRVVATAAALAAADTATATVTPGAPAQVRGVPRDTVVILGRQYRQGAEALDRANNVIGPVTATVTTTTPSTCTVASDGTVSGVGYGICLLTVSGANASKSMQPRVVPSGSILVRRGTAIGTLSLDGSGFTKITDVDTTITTSVQWLAFGEIAFWESIDAGHTRLVISDTQGIQRRMPPLPYPASPRRVSGDGAWLLVGLLDTTNYLALTDVVRARSDGSSAATVFAKCCFAFAVRPDLSVDGSKLAFADAVNGLGYYVNLAVSRSNYIGEAQSLRFSQDGTQLVRVISNGALIGQDAGDVASPSHDIAGGPGGFSFDRTAGWSPDSKWILAAGGAVWWAVPSTAGSAALLMLPSSIGSTYVVLDGWKP